MTLTVKHSRIVASAILAAIAAAIWLPRALALDQFATTDEPLWLTRAANLYCALSRGDLASTFQREHPGVTTMWAGAAGLAWYWPDYGNNCPYLASKEDHERVFQEHGLQAATLLAAGRFVMVLGNTVALVLAFVFARRLLGLLPAAVGLMLIAFDPFHAAFSRLLHLDGLLGSLALLALLAFASYLEGRRPLALVVSGVAAGLSWLTKSPGLLLVPFAGLMVLIDLGQRLHRRAAAWSARTAWRTARPLLAWAAVGGVVFVALWPAMWVDPGGVLARMFDLAGAYASGGHDSPVFFAGTVAEDGQLGAPFWYFYPLTYLWRSTPAVLLGLLAAAAAFARKRGPLDRPAVRRTVVACLLFAAAFAAALTLSAKKFDRYLLPAYAPLDLVAGVGWVAAARWIGDRPFAFRWRWLVPVLLGVPVAAQLAVMLPAFPYYLSYYNPLMGGSGRAAQVMMIGWGEGLDQAARYLDQKPDASQLRVFSWYRTGSFSYLFAGSSDEIPYPPKWADIDLQRILNADYAVIYQAQQQQRQIPAALLGCLAQEAPEHAIWINGLEYVRIYRLGYHLDADPAYVPAGAQFGDRILLEGYKLSPGTFEAGGAIPIWLSWKALQAPGERFKVFVQLLDGSGVLVAQNDAEPAAWSRPTDGWQSGERITDAHGVPLPPDLPPGTYTLLVGMYGASGERLAVTQAGEPVGDALVLRQVVVGGHLQ